MLVAGASALLWAPLAAQAGLSSLPGSVTLSASHLTSVGVMVLGTATTDLSVSLAAGSTGPLSLTTSWNVDPAEPLTVRLAAFTDGPDASLETALAGADSRAARVLAPVDVTGSQVPTKREQLERGRPMASLFTQGAASLVGRGGRADDLQVRGVGTLTVVAITQ